jgi:hypothetical protein
MKGNITLIDFVSPWNSRTPLRAKTGKNACLSFPRTAVLAATELDWTLLISLNLA